MEPPEPAQRPEPLPPPLAESPATPVQVVAEPPVKRVKVRSTADIFAELDSLRRLATQGGKPKSSAPPKPAPVVEFHLSPEVLRTARRLSIAFLFEDQEGNVVQQREAQFELESDRDVHNIQIKLKTDRG